MCEYCEKLTNSHKMDSDWEKHQELLNMATDSTDVYFTETMASIVLPTPISKKRHSEDGLTSLIEIYYADDKRRVTHFHIPIRYCPICGRDLSGKAQEE